jgi:hypothetical protein
LRGVKGRHLHSEEGALVLFSMIIGCKFETDPQLVFQGIRDQKVPECLIICRVNLRTNHQREQSILVTVKDPAELPLEIGRELANHLFGDTLVVLLIVSQVYILCKLDHIRMI